MTLNEMIDARRSVRKYKSTPLPREVLQEVLDAGRRAPSAKNQQNWHFTAVESTALRQGLVDACFGQAMVGQAPVCLVVWASEDQSMPCGQSAASVDCSIATSFMVLKATELGLGTCWLGAFNPNLVKSMLNLPGGATVVAVMPLGYADEAPAPRGRKPLEEISDIREE